MDRKNWTLLAIAAAKGQSLSPVQLQKSLFLLGKGYPNEVGKRFYQFTPYNYGPFDASIYQDAAELALCGFITIRRTPGQAWSEYSATQAGLNEAARIAKKAPAEAHKYLCRVVEWARRLSFSELLRTIYHHFPEYRVNSVFQT